MNHGDMRPADYLAIFMVSTATLFAWVVPELARWMLLAMVIFGIHGLLKERGVL